MAAANNRSSRNRGLSEKTKRSLLIGSGSVLCLMLGWWAYYTFTTMSPPDLKKATPQQVADFFVSSIQSIKANRSWVGAIFIWNLNWRTFADPHTSETAIFGILNPDWTGRLIYNRLKDMPK